MSCCVTHCLKSLQTQHRRSDFNHNKMELSRASLTSVGPHAISVSVPGISWRLRCWWLKFFQEWTSAMEAYDPVFDDIDRAFLQRVGVKVSVCLGPLTAPWHPRIPSRALPGFLLHAGCHLTC